MAAFICKVCGAALQLSAGDKICRCGSCGVTQTVPLIDDEDKAELCRSAERYRREYRYDKAIELYEELIRAYPTDADLYWSMLLCRYGVEFTKVGEGQPSVALNRTQARSLLSDEDYRMALRYCDREQRSVMEKQAAEIDRTRRRIVELSRGGERYDIYLCCRERDERGLRTPESAAAKSLYTRLTNDGFSVFYPDITLDEVQGSEWEPHIYSALTNARVMIVIGFSGGSFADVWVSNAYSRFAYLAAEDSRRVIIPMYRGMDAEGLPEVLKPYQAVDMTRLGYENDLITSLGNLLGASVLRKAPAETVQKSDPLLRRANIHLADNEFAAAATAANKLLEADPENGEAYLILLMAEYETNSLETLRVDFSVSENYRNAMKYGSEGLRFRLRSYLNSALYGKYTEILSKAQNPAAYREAAEGFRMLGEYQDSAQLAEKADALAVQQERTNEEQRLLYVYSDCVAKLNSSNNIPELQNVQLFLAELGDYRDSRQLASQCASKIQRLSAQQRAIDAGFYTRRTSGAKKAVVIAACVILVLVMTSVAMLVTVSNMAVEEVPTTVTSAVESGGSSYIKVNSELHEIEKLISDGEPSEAYDRCTELLQENMTYEQEQRARFLSGKALVEMGKYDQAYAVFETLGDYSGSDKWKLECRYRQAIELLQYNDTAAAEAIFIELDGYSDSEDYLNYMRYTQAQELYESGDLTMARAIFKGLDDYDDSRSRYEEITCELAAQKIDSGNYDEAFELLQDVDNDSAAELRAEYYAWRAAQCINEGNYKAAEKALWALRGVAGYEQTRAEGYIALIEYYKSNGEDYTAERLVEYLAEIDGYELMAQDILNAESEPQPAVSADVAAFGAEMVDNYSVGQVFVFGSFEQNGNVSDGAEPIEWVVLDNDGKYLSAISVKVLCVQPYGASETWEDSWLRNYLNMDFYYRAFTQQERSYLSTRDLIGVPSDDVMNTDPVIIPNHSDDFINLADDLRIAEYSASAKAENERYGVSTEYSWWAGYASPHEPYVADSIYSMSRWAGISEENHGVRPVITFRKY